MYLLFILVSRHYFGIQKYTHTYKLAQTCNQTFEMSKCKHIHKHATTYSYRKCQNVNICYKSLFMAPCHRTEATKATLFLTFTTNVQPLITGPPLDLILGGGRSSGYSDSILNPVFRSNIRWWAEFRIFGLRSRPPILTSASAMPFPWEFTYATSRK